MVDIQVGKLGWELLANAPATAKTTRYVTEVVHDQQPDPTAELQIGKLVWELLAEVPPAVKTTRYVVEVLHDQQADPAAELQVGKLSMELLALQQQVVKTTRYVVEVLHDQQPDPTAELQIGKLSWEVAAESFVRLSPCNVPAFWRYFSHNWAKEFRVETRFNTAVSRGAQSLSEDRTQKWERPRRTVRIEWAENGLDDRRNLMDLIQTVREFSREDWMVPFSSDCGLITRNEITSATFVEGIFDDRRFFLGGRVAIVKFNRSTQDVQDENGDLFGVHLTTLLNTAGSGEFELTDPLPFDIDGGAAFMVPLICVIPNLLTVVKQHHCRLWQISVEFTEDGGPTCLPGLIEGNPPGFDVYRDRPIFRPRHNYANPLNIEVLQEGTQQEIGRNTETFIRGATQRVKHRIRMNEERDLAFDYIRFFESRKGRLRSFWLIDQEMIFEVLDIEPTFIDVRPVGDFVEFQENMEFFGFMMKDGTCFVREIVTFNDLGSVWRLSVVDSLPSGLAFQDVVLAGRARDTRMIEDTFEERWFHGNVVKFQVKTISLLEEKDVTLDP